MDIQDQSATPPQNSDDNVPVDELDLEQLEDVSGGTTNNCTINYCKPS